MKTRRYLIGLIFLLLVGQSFAATKSDTAKEKRWEEQIVPDLMTGKAVHLEAAGTRFLALYAPATGKPMHGGIILLHGMGVHPAWPAVIEPLRTALPDKGWTTLSLQMPILRNGAPIKEYLPLMPEAPGRIQAGVNFLKRKGITNIVMVCHSLGNTMANVYLQKHPDPAIHGYIAIGMYNEFKKHYNNGLALRRIHMPVFNLYGSADDRAVLFTRKYGNKAHKANKFYTQLMVKSADHFFTDMQDTLVKDVENWLNKNAAGK